MSKFLNQSEIDALLNQNYVQEDNLMPEELDALGEIANISMGSGATALSELVNHKVLITNPQVMQIKMEDFLRQLPQPHLAIRVEFISGLLGSNILVISNRDAVILAKMMMGEDPTADHDYLDEIQISAASEAMNQMIASAATAMSQVFQRTVNISPPDIKPFDDDMVNQLSIKSKLVVIKFRMTVGEFLQSELFQMLPIETAREQARLLFETTDLGQASAKSGYNSLTEKATEAAQEKASLSSEPTDEGNIDLILDIPLNVSVVLGKTKKTIKEILSYQSGSIVELNRLVDENVDVLVNNVLVAKGEVVVINDNFGVRITNIINAGERINHLKNCSLI